MSRQIKVRLYSKTAKKYIDYITIGFSKSGELRMYSTETGTGPVLEDNYIVEQGTGLKDKNGKEIYDGDIVRVSYGYNYEVRQFRTGAWRIGRDDLCVWADSSEVVGNIHEGIMPKN